MIRPAVLDRRRAGVLLHPTSLPGGGFDAGARRFVDFMQACGLSVWQMLPLGPTHAERSPYRCLSVRAMNPELIDPVQLAADGWLESAPLQQPRSTWLHAAFASMALPVLAGERAAFEAFCMREAAWLEDFALFQALRDYHDRRPWWEWPAPLRDREPAAIEAAVSGLDEALSLIRFEQFLVLRQYEQLRAYARERGIQLFGDMSIFVAHDSAEVWAHREYFKLDAGGHPQVVAGVPPDYFSATGQRWGNPLYDWARLRQDGFRWWGDRLATDLERFDLVRIDHFRGFEACWEIPVHEATAIHGRWVEVPGEALFEALRARFAVLPLVAEDLGIITPAVTALRERYGFPGMLVLQFAFEGGAGNPYLPHNHRPEAVVYTGTHDNDTTLGWFQALPAAGRQQVLDYLDTRESMPWALVRAALASVAQLAVIPMQDLLELGSAHRMNTPGQAGNNWRWRLDWSWVPPDTAERVRRLVEMYGRAET
jgi:4-alpha-glucanotransferase